MGVGRGFEPTPEPPLDPPLNYTKSDSVNLLIGFTFGNANIHILKFPLNKKKTVVKAYYIYA